MKKILKNICILYTVIMIAWFTMSYCEIMLKKESRNPEYSDKNIIVNLTEWAYDFFGYEK